MRIQWIGAAALPLVLGALLTSAQAQGKGKEKGGGEAKAHGNADVHQAQGKGGGAARGAEQSAVRAQPPGQAQGKGRGQEMVRSRPQSVARSNAPGRSMAVKAQPERKDMRENARPAQKLVRESRGEVERSSVAARMAGSALLHAKERGASNDAFIVVPTGRRIDIRNRSGVVLLDLDEARARSLGSWQVVPLDSRVKNGSPSFCRSGAGHPVWGRQWCIDKGFGLGTSSDLRWARATDLRDVVFLRTPETALLTRDALATVLGPVVLDRLALQAITLGLVDPLVGRWLGQPAGPRVLLLTSGAHPVAELVDVNRDNRADVMLVALRPR